MVVVKMTNVIKELINSVKRQVQDGDTIDELTNIIKQKKYRQAFLIFTDLKETGRWKLNDIDEKLLEEFWWEYAN